ncbi:acyltransferase family protein [Ancylobacter mangrovi]|uniref:acyltransferase family protein n=1 Tax=Ancylobacter mangrovi TaxID=2972472 RepID=UPI00216325A0|nr:acyltransferase [Ancylobacter mangrovi]MCS0501308.1 acyltransferase [Ancylobacter mangrovi]
MCDESKMGARGLSTMRLDGLTSKRFLVGEKTDKLAPLTGLRFFASAAIVYFHIQGSYGTERISFPLANGVMLFFVLSGFIITYVYPELPDQKVVIRYLTARFARIWPLHLTCFFLTIILYIGWQGSPEQTKNAVINVLLLHAWVPFLSVIFSFNSVSWTISVEAFFYVMFPLLIANFGRTWIWKLSFAFGLGLMMCAITAYAGVPISGGPNQVIGTTLLSVNPLARLFEFISGMCCCLAWRRYGHLMPRSFAAASVIEVALIAFMLWYGLNVSAVSWAIGQATFPPFGWWLNFGPALLPCAVALIFVLASGHGVVGWVLGTRPLVFLGEISFATYMVHQIVQNSFTYHFSALQGMPSWLALPTYLLTTFIASTVLFLVVERPARNWITGRSRLRRPIGQEAMAAP